MKHGTFQLFNALPCFALGVASVFDLGAVIDIAGYGKGPAQIDSQAVSSDWYTVGEDLQQAMDKYKKGFR